MIVDLNVGHGFAVEFTDAKRVDYAQDGVTISFYDATDALVLEFDKLRNRFCVAHLPRCKVGCQRGDLTIDTLVYGFSVY